MCEESVQGCLRGSPELLVTLVKHFGVASSWRCKDARQRQSAQVSEQYYCRPGDVRADGDHSLRFLRIRRLAGLGRSLSCGPLFAWHAGCRLEPGAECLSSEGALCQAGRAGGASQARPFGAPGSEYDTCFSRREEARQRVSRRWAPRSARRRR
jgi:hypothetical protein